MIELRDVLMIVLTAVSTGAATWAAMRVELRYLKESRDDHEKRIREVEHELIEVRAER